MPVSGKKRNAKGDILEGGKVQSKKYGTGSTTVDYAVICTGGTILMDADDKFHESSFAELLETWIEKYNLDVPACNLHIYVPTKSEGLIDSSNASIHSWVPLLNFLLYLSKECDIAYSGVLVLHGTDSMPYAVALADFALPCLWFPVIFTGAQVKAYKTVETKSTAKRARTSEASGPVSPVIADDAMSKDGAASVVATRKGRKSKDDGSDAYENVCFALRALKELHDMGHKHERHRGDHATTKSVVALAFNGKLFSGTRLVKLSSTDKDAFGTPTRHPLMNWQQPISKGKAPKEGSSGKNLHIDADGIKEILHTPQAKVVYCEALGGPMSDMLPTGSASAIGASAPAAWPILRVYQVAPGNPLPPLDGVAGLIIQAYGAGNLPDEVRRALFQACSKGVFVVITSECAHGGVLEMYNTAAVRFGPSPDTPPSGEAEWYESIKALLGLEERAPTLPELKEKCENVDAHILTCGDITVHAAWAKLMVALYDYAAAGRAPNSKEDANNLRDLFAKRWRDEIDD